METNSDKEQIKKDFSLLETAQMLELEVRDTDGTQAIRCINHEPDNHPSLVLMPDVNRFQCQSCNWKGDILDLVQKVKKCSFVEAMEFFLVPAEKPAPANTFNAHNPYKYLAERGIKPETAKHFGLELKKHDKSENKCKDPGCGKTGDPTNIAIPIMKADGFVRYKYRVINPVGKQPRYWFDKGTNARQLFKTSLEYKGKKATRIFLTEGEFDAIVVWQETKLPAWTAVTGKATDVSKFAEDFAGMDKIYIAYDNDMAGEEGALEVADALGKDRCFRVRVPKNMGKDWTDFFLHGGSAQDFGELLRLAKPYSDPSLVDNLEEQRQSDMFTVTTGISYIDNIIGGFYSANTYILGGLEKSGKSSLLLNFLTSMLREKKYMVGYVNTEFTLSEFAIRMTALAENKPKSEIAKDFDVYKSWLAEYQDQMFYAGLEDGALTIDGRLDFKRTLNKLEFFADRGMKVLFFDNITSFSSVDSKKSSWETLSKCIQELVTFSKRRKVVVIIVIHQKGNTVVVESAARIKKMLDEGRPSDIFKNDIVHIRRPTVSDLFGGGAALSQVSGTILVWRPFQKFTEQSYNAQTQIIMESFRHSQGGESQVVFNGAIGKFEEEYDDVKNNVFPWEKPSSATVQQEEDK